MIPKLWLILCLLWLCVNGISEDLEVSSCGTLIVIISAPSIFRQEISWFLSDSKRSSTKS